MGCGEVFVKYILYITNTIFALAGIALIGVGAGCLIVMPSAELGFESSHTMGSVATIVVGVTVLLIAIFGCFGGMTKNHCILVTYTIFMIVLMIMKLTLSVLIFVNLNYVKDRVVELLNKAFTDANMKSVDLVQQSLKCCGTTGPGSYGLQIILFALPESCCPPNTKICSGVTAYTEGCNDAMRNLVDIFGTGVGVIAIVSVCISLVAIVFSLCLAKHINRNKIRRYQYAGVHNY